MMTEAFAGARRGVSAEMPRAVSDSAMAADEQAGVILTTPRHTGIALRTSRRQRPRKPGGDCGSPPEGLLVPDYCQRTAAIGGSQPADAEGSTERHPCTDQRGLNLTPSLPTEPGPGLDRRDDFVDGLRDAIEVPVVEQAGVVDG